MHPGPHLFVASSNVCGWSDQSEAKRSKKYLVMLVANEVFPLHRRHPLQAASCVTARGAMRARRASAETRSRGQ